MAEENKGTVFLAFVAGALVGANWPKIKEFLAPYLGLLGEKGAGLYAGASKLMAEKKEGFEDFLAEQKVKAVKKTPRRRKVKV